jgi:hypothetical protein
MPENQELDVATQAARFRTSLMRIVAECPKVEPVEPKDEKSYLTWLLLQQLWRIGKIANNGLQSV